MLYALWAGTATAQEVCEFGARFESIEGQVEVSRNGTTVWFAAADGDLFCPGDAFRVTSYSRAALRLHDGTLQRLDPSAAARWKLTEDRSRSLWEMLRGIIHIISRDPRALEYETPFANAGLKGTEFLISVTENATEITVIEGAVEMQSASGTATVAAGERGIARAGAPVSVEPMADYLDYLSWTRHYPELSSLPAIAADQLPSADQLNDPVFYASRAAQRLRRGQIDAAAADLAEALALDPANSYARIVGALLPGVSSDPDTSGLQQIAEGGGPDAVPALLVQALLRQRANDWVGARESLEAAVALDQGNALVWARLGEARLASGDLRGARAAVGRAFEIEPGNAHAYTVLGFARLADFDTAGAIEAFARAVDLDSALPLAQLGLGIALTRSGDRMAGRRAIELAVLLDPEESRLRSYSGNAYFDERRVDLASSQVDLARQMNPDEPTPLVYDTFYKQSANNPIEALRDFDRASALNGDQSIYRSSLYIDEDPAVRSGAVGRLYSDLGHERLALSSGMRSIQGASRDHSGHRLLADSYVALPRHQIARANELFYSQLLQPMNATAIPPQLAEPNLFILDTAGPAALSHNEFNPMLASNHLTVQGAATVGGNDTHGEHLTFSGIHDRVSFSAGWFGFETVGFRENNDLDTEVGNVFVQLRPNAQASWIGELRTTETEKGDQRLLFHNDRYNPELRQIDSVDSLRLGMHRRLGESGDLLAAVHYQEVDSSFSVGPALSVDGSFDGHALDLQHLYRRDRWQITSGANLIRRQGLQTSTSILSVPFPPFIIEEVSSNETRTEQQSAYLYSDFEWTQSIIMTFGASVDKLDSLDASQQEFNPKLGLRWAPNARTTVRAAAFRTLQGPLVSRENIQPRLEPTTIAGFNQFFFGSEGDEVDRYGLGLDRRLSSDLSYGIEFSRRDVGTSVFVFEPPIGLYLLPIEIAESSGRAYAYWTPNTAIALSAELQKDVFDNGGHVLADGYARLETYRLPMQLKYFHSSGLGAGIRLTYADQSGDFGEEILGPGGIENMLVYDEDRFWVVDASLTYRLSGRRGMLNLNVYNLFDKDYHFQDLDPENPRIMPDRLVSVGFTLAL